MSHPNYLIYHAQLHSERKRCSFDVVRANDREVGKGTLEWIVKCLDALELDVFAREPWEIAPFCSPTYGDVAGVHWTDRNPMAWRVTVTLREPYRWPTFPFRASEESLMDVDPTAPMPEYERPDYFIFTERPGVVIAAFPDVDVEATKEKIKALQLPHATLTEFWELTPELAQCRIHVGNLKFPDDEYRLKDTAQACVDAGALCNWSQLAPYNEV